MDEITPVSASEPRNNEREDQPRLAKFLCSFGGSVLPRPLDGRLRYVGGETRIVPVPRNISFSNLMQRMHEIFDGTDLIKYQQPDEDLDALVSVVNDDDVMNMMEEYDKLISSGEPCSRLRIFLFSQNVMEDDALNSPSFDAFSERESERRYVDALNCLIDPKSGLNVTDMEGSLHDNISLRHLNVPKPSTYGPKFSDVDSPYNGAGHYSPKVYNPQSHDMLNNLPFGAEDFNEKSGYPRNFTRGDHLNDANGTYCEHCIHTPYHQRSGCITLDARYLESQHRYHTDHGHNGFNHQHGDYYHNNVDNNDYYNYYRNEANGNDRTRAPHNPLNYCYDDVSVSRAPEPYTPDGSRVNYVYPQGNVYNMHDNAHFYNTQVSPEVGNNEMFHNTTQQGENPSQQYNQAVMYNLESLYQVPQNVPPISSLRYKTQVNMLAVANPNPYESSNVVGVNPVFGRVIQDGTPGGGISPVYVGTPNAGLNPVFRGAQDGISNGMNPILVKATPDGTSNEGINPIFVRDTPDATSNGGIKKPSFIIGTPEDSPSFSGAGPFERIANHWVGSSENCWPNISGLDSSANIPEYSQLPGSRLNPNCSLIARPMAAETAFVRTSIVESPVAESPVKKIPGSENLVVENEIIVAPILDQSSSKKDNTTFVGITPVKTVEEPSALLELHKVAICVKEKSTGGALEDGECLRLKEKTNDEESNLHGITPENGDIDHEVEIESTESDGVSRIESTTAELEAFNKGLQTIKNEDLEETRELGHGTYGTVYHGKWRGSDVAIKRIKASCFSVRPSERSKLIADFWNEAQILSGLHHPNVVSFYGVVRDGPDGGLATVTEFMVNGSLKQFLHKKDRTIDRRKRIILAMDAAFGMEYLHSKNIVHFDLKCENLLVNMKDAQRPICKIGDLGLSKVKQQTLVSGGLRGTLPWMAPELLNEKNNMVTDKVDVYSFGICLWELLTGEEPYAEMKTPSIIGGLLNDTLRPEIPSWCDPEWKALMQSCWSTDPNERPSFSEISQKLRKMAPK